jgi:hypothetical protein
MARSEITLGFVGSGKVEKRNAYALLNDFIEASGGNAKFILPLTKTFWNEALDIVSQYAVDKGIPVEAIVDDTTSKVRELKAMLGGARRQHQSNAVPNKMAALLDEARKGTLIVLWDDEDDAALDAVRAAHEKGVALLELTRGLDRIELVNEGDGEDAEPESDEVEEVIVGQDENDEDVVEEVAQDEDEDAGQDDAEDETAEELEENEGEEDDPEEDAEIEAEDDVDGDDDDAEEDGEFPEDEEFSLPEEDESDVAVLDMEADIADEVRQVTGMSEFQQRLLAVLERTSEALVAAINAAMADDAGPAPAAAPAPTKAASSKPAAARPAKKVAAPVKKAAPAKKTTAPPAKAVEKPATKRTIPAKKAATPAKAETNGGMSKAAAQKIIDAYRPRRGRPPAEVTEARKILGLA